MKSLQWELQRNLAIVLIVVMAGIWTTGLLLPRQLQTPTAISTAISSNIQCSMADKNCETTVAPKAHRRFTWLFPMLASSGIIVILLLQGILIRRSFRKFTPIQQELRQLERGQISQLSEQVPVEIKPLIQELNHVLNRAQERIERSRHSLGNLAHALKGPINLLQQNLDKPEPDKYQARQQLERLKQLTERELKRARMAGIGNSTQRFNPHQDLENLRKVLQQIHQKPDHCITLRIADSINAGKDREDMLELLGNLLDNACKWATQNVSCQLWQEQHKLYIRIEDDGPGLDETELNQLTARGIRLDESIGGHGLGLAICKDIVNLYAGNITFSRSATLGGLRVDISL